MSIPSTHQAFVEADGVKVFYRFANPAGVAADDVAAGQDAPTIVLLHGFPSSSFMFRHLIPLLAQRGYRVIAPDLPSFGFTEVPAARNYEYTFASLATTFGAFVEALQLAADNRQFAAYIFDYGAPTLFRFALNEKAAGRKKAIGAVITQNGNAYTEGLGSDFWAPIKAYWQSGPTKDADPATRAALGEAALALPFTRFQYVEGAPNGGRDVPPETYHLDQALLERPGIKDHQLDLFYDYQTNVALYPKIQELLRVADTPVLALWGQNDPCFIAPGAEAFRRDVKRFELQWLKTGHFALETNEPVAAEAIDNFLKKYKVF
ncbi:hydrolase [Sporothrix schenckii 1099-18]|uniref:AB hydrolase-1 domain-containing protein n=2 Tax=Sporothrix schenckii TaxID=29908 RepID=U7Q5L2_SPOS1|nr:hydrolase [Sporothrix schenckii 1099-18]ERT01996.1 hypothetical protein HMPREF1624_00291 [Sporothrix schenckii ATCC 58251]KJR80829.1 hydrolase [Sporothrix schenckii 1099-18]